MLKYAGPACFRRFLVHCEAYVEAVAIEAELRERHEVLDMVAFEALRRENSAIRLCFGLFEFVLGVDLPDFVFENEDFMNLYWAAADMVCWSNVRFYGQHPFFQNLKKLTADHQDVYSYNMEQAKGIGGNNIVTVLMRAQHVDLQTAADFVGYHFRTLMDKFTEGKKNLPSWGLEVDTGVQAYIQAMEHWIIGNLDWSFETKRYFGSQHDEVKRTLLVTLRSREA